MLSTNVQLHPGGDLEIFDAVVSTKSGWHSVYSCSVKEQIENRRCSIVIRCSQASYKP